MGKDHPQFLPQIFGRKKRIKHRWRKPRGIDSKKRIGKQYMGAVPGIGWKSNRKTRGLHPSGLKEILIYNPQQLEGKSNVAVKIASGVGQRKRKIIIDKANSMKLKVLNAKTKV